MEGPFPTLNNQEGPGTRALLRVLSPGERQGAPPGPADYLEQVPRVAQNLQAISEH